jgi:hypothetical protein
MRRALLRACFPLRSILCTYGATVALIGDAPHLVRVPFGARLGFAPYSYCGTNRRRTLFDTCPYLMPQPLFII